MRIVTWNVHRRKKMDEHWKLLDEHIKPDIVVFQEFNTDISPPPRRFETRTACINSENRSIVWDSVPVWGTAILSQQFPLKPIELKESTFEHKKIEDHYSGRIVAASTEFKGVTVDIFGLHVPITGKWARFNLAKMVSMAEKSRIGDEMIILGDFNFGDTFDDGGKTDNRDYFNKILKEHSLVDAYKKHHKAHSYTFRSVRNRDFRHHLDHILVSEGLSARLKNCDIYPTPWELSDHRLVFADIE
jgi:exonuclease III